MIKFLFEIIYIIWVVLANVLTFCGYTRLKEAQTNYKNIYEKYEKSTNSINQIYDENKVLLNDMGNDTKKAFEALNKASIILSRNNLKQKENGYYSQTKNSPVELQQIEKIKKISARFSNALSASVSASSGGASVARMEYGTTIRQNNHLYKPRVVTQAVRLLNNLTSSPS